ncbi:MAG: ammonium transporter [Cyanophyceae cyanobacterium]
MIIGVAIALAAAPAIATEPPPIPADRLLPEWKIVANTLWVLLTGFLVFFMNAGFAMLETGFCRYKNAVNMLSKNLIVFALSTLAYWATGFAIMFGNGNEVMGYSGFFLIGPDNSPLTDIAYEGTFEALGWAAVPLKAKFFFQLAFAGTAATIVSGAVAERVRFLAFLMFSLLLVGFSYGVTGHWVWGNGWLAQFGFYDFAGSTLVHSVGGWAGLVGAVMLGPRLEKYSEGRITAIPGHNMALSTLGCLILWLGWFGFNPGSLMAADPDAIVHILLTTNMSAAAAALAATLVSWLYFGKPDLTMIINGVLAGLVAVTAACAYVSLAGAVVIGAIAGVMVVFSVVLLERLRVDDPVGAISVHLVCGIWGTLAVGLFSVGPNVYPWYGAANGPLAGLLLGGSVDQLLTQLLGVLSVGGFTAAFSTVVWLLLRFTVGIRVTPTEEYEGLDLSEHSMEAYSGFLKE